MVIKSDEVGDFKDIPVLHISKIDVRTKIVGNESEIAICNNPDNDNPTPTDDVLHGIDMLIVGNAKALRWLGELLIEQADKTPINRAGYCAVSNESPKEGNKEDDSPISLPPIMVYDNCTSCNAPLKKPITARLGANILCSSCIDKQPVLSTCDECGGTLKTAEDENFIGMKQHCKSCYAKYLSSLEKTIKEDLVPYHYCTYCHTRLSKEKLGKVGEIVLCTKCLCNK